MSKSETELQRELFWRLDCSVNAYIEIEEPIPEQEVPHIFYQRIDCYSYNFEWTTFKLLVVGFGLLVPLVEDIPLAEFLLELRFLLIPLAVFWLEATALLLLLCDARLVLLLKSFVRL